MKKPKRIHFKAAGATQPAKDANILRALSNVARSAETVAKCLSCLGAACGKIKDAGIIHARRSEMVVQDPNRLAQYNASPGIISQQPLTDFTAVKAETRAAIYANKEKLDRIELEGTYAAVAMVRDSKTRATSLVSPGGKIALAPNGNFIQL